MRRPHRRKVVDASEPKGKSADKLGYIMRQVKFTLRFIRLEIIVLSVFALSVWAAQTWRIDEQGQWQQAGGDRQEQFLLRVAGMKKLVDTAKPKMVRSSAEKLKADFPEIAGDDFDSFVKAEVLLASSKLTKAVRQYQKFLDEYPASPLREAALERQFEIANECLSGRKKRVLLLFTMRRYAEGIRIMEKISDRAGNADIAKRALLAVAGNYEKRGKNEQAYLKWSEISSRWPTGQIGKDALYGMARNKYATFRGSIYDASGLISARSYYENYKLRYPDDAQQMKVDEIITGIDEQLAEKELYTAGYYSRTGSIEAAKLYYQMVVDNWPNTSAGRAAAEQLNQTSSFGTEDEN